MSKPKAKQEFDDRSARGSLFSLRFLLCILLIAAGIAWIVVYINYAKDAALFDDALGGKKPGTPAPWMSDLKNWNYLIGFGLIFLGLGASAHPSTPLGRGRGVVVGMLGCFILGLIWICTFYVVSNDPSKIPIMKDLEQYNLLIGIGFMAVGFTFATRWE